MLEYQYQYQVMQHTTLHRIHYNDLRGAACQQLVCEYHAPFGVACAFASNRSGLAPDPDANSKMAIQCKEIRGSVCYLGQTDTFGSAITASVSSINTARLGCSPQSTSPPLSATHTTSISLIRSRLRAG